MNEHESEREASGRDDWSRQWRQVRPLVPAPVRSRVMASVRQELAVLGPRSQSQPHAWSWLAVVAAVLVLWIHASWSVSLAEPAPRLNRSIISLEAHHAALIEAAEP